MMPAAPKKKTRIRNPEITRAKLLQAAVDLIAEKGPEALSLKEVAKRADVSRSATYLHFEDRDHLLSETKKWIAQSLLEGVQGFDQTTPLYERTLHTNSLIIKNPEVSRAMMVDAITKGELDASHPLYKAIMDRLKYLRKKKQLPKDIDLEVRAYIHLGSIAAALLFQSQHEGDDPAGLAERFTKEWVRILQASY